MKNCHYYYRPMPLKRKMSLRLKNLGSNAADAAISVEKQANSDGRNWKISVPYDLVRRDSVYPKDASSLLYGLNVPGAQ